MTQEAARAAEAAHTQSQSQSQSQSRIPPASGADAHGPAHAPVVQRPPVRDFAPGRQQPPGKLEHLLGGQEVTAGERRGTIPSTFDPGTNQNGPAPRAKVSSKTHSTRRESALSKKITASFLAHLERPTPVRRNPRIGEFLVEQKDVIEGLLKYRKRTAWGKHKPLVPRQPIAATPRKPQLREALTDALKKAAVKIHLSKFAFSEETEAKWTRKRIMNGSEHFCRCWALISADGMSVVGACTLRINTFCEQGAQKEGAQKGRKWAQVMNISANPEGHGYGSVMFEQLEEVLKAEQIYLVVLYPADNGAAPKFWGKMGFKERGGKTGRPSLLPSEEAVNGKLIQECDVSTGMSLPRWEKDLLARTLPRRASSENV